jgi:hypothetical protein
MVDVVGSTNEAATSSGASIMSFGAGSVKSHPMPSPDTNKASAVISVANRPARRDGSGFVVCSMVMCHYLA